MFNPAQILQMMGSKANPQAFMQQMFGNNPTFGRTMQMVQGKSPAEVQQIIRNVAKARGMSDTQLNQFVGQFGLKL